MSAGASSAAPIVRTSAPTSSGRDQVVGKRPEDFRDAADARCNDWQSGGDGLEHNVRQRFGARGNDQHATHGEGLTGRTVTGEAHQVGDAAAFRQRPERGTLRPFAGNGRAHAPALDLEHRQRRDEDVEGFDRTQFAETDDIGCVRTRRDRREFRLADAVVHDAHHGRRAADFGAEQAGDVAAFEQEQIRAPLQEPFERAVEAASKRARPVNHRAAMRRVDADGVRRARSEPRQSRALGAVTVQDVGGGVPDLPRDKTQRADIGGAKLARDGDALQPERQMRRELGKRRVGARPAGR